MMKKNILFLLILFLFSCSSNASLKQAIFNNDIEKVNSYIRNGAEVTTEDKLGNNALMIAARNNDLELAKFLFEKNIPLNQQNHIGNSALWFACVNNNFDMVKYLIENGADPYLKNILDSTILGTAVNSGNIEMVQYLLERGVKDIDGDAVVNAVREHQPVILKMLLEIDPNTNYEPAAGWTLLNYAKEDGAQEIVDILEAYGAK